MEWFSVDKAGLAKLVERRGKAFAVLELVQNCWDTEATEVRVDVEPVEGRALARVRVEDDDPNGFRNLAHAFTLFAESEKKGDPEKRGRFNLGEKLVLALCSEAEIVTTTGYVVFGPEGRRLGKKRRERGSVFEGTMRLTREDVAEIDAAMKRVLVPHHVSTYYRGERLLPREVVATSCTHLPTELADEDGILRRKTRAARMLIVEPRSGEKPTLYEMGIPVVELSGGERWHVDVQQKVPLNFERDNVTPGYLQTVRVALADAMREKLAKEDSTTIWVNAAIEDERVSSEVVEKVLDERFGKKRAIFDPSDPEANKQLVDEGYAIVHGGTLSKGQWDNVKAAGLVLPAGQIRPSAFRYSADGRPEKVVPFEEWDSGMLHVRAVACKIARAVLGFELAVKIVNEPVAIPFAAMYSREQKQITFNLGRLGRDWFERCPGAEHVELIVHELAHDKVDDHLTRAFSDEAVRIAVALVEHAEMLRELGYGRRD